MRIKRKTVMSWSSRKKKEGIFVPFILSEEIFFNICVLSQSVVYWSHFHNIKKDTAWSFCYFFLFSFTFLSTFVLKYWIECFFSDLRNKRNSWFILCFEKYKWNINLHCTIEKRLAFLICKVIYKLSCLYINCISSYI